MIDHINATETCHIMTIEDPIEFLIRDKRSIVNQREVGVDTMSFGQALKSALRQDPDVILVGEMRDLETIETALTAAETGHLVMSTLHTLDATETINRIISAFPPYQQKQVRLQLGSVLKGGHLAAPGAARRRQGPRRRRRGAHRHRPRARAHRGQGPHQGDPRRHRRRAHRRYGMQTFDQSLMSAAASRAHHLRGGAPAGDQPGRLRAARLSGISAHQRRALGRLRGLARTGTPPRAAWPSPSAAHPRPRAARRHRFRPAGARVPPPGGRPRRSGASTPPRRARARAACAEAGRRLDRAPRRGRRLPHRAVLDRSRAAHHRVAAALIPPPALSSPRADLVRPPTPARTSDPPQPCRAAAGR